VVAVPQLGPGKEDNGDDRGLSLITGDSADDYKFRTPALRNVGRTGPYFHDGAVTTLREAVMHHLDPVTCNENYDVTQLREDFRPLVDTSAEREAARLAAVAPQLSGLRAFSDDEVDALVAFLESLTDPDAGQVRVPRSVPSGLPVKD
jgi:cytochrome c peroxidase